MNADKLLEEAILYAASVYGRKPIDMLAKEYIRLVATKYHALVEKQERPPDEGYCEHDWSYPPEFCPVCNKRVPIIRH